jgi:hypothetical protein
MPPDPVVPSPPPSGPLPPFPLDGSAIPPAAEVPGLVRLVGPHREIWERALPYLDVRDNDVHSLYAYGLATALLDEIPQARAEVVLPAVLLHDTGWKMVDPALILPAISPGPGGAQSARRQQTVRRHETEGAVIAARILADVGHPTRDAAEIVAIIDGHDTREEALSVEDALVKDADKLWRVTPHGLRTIGSWFCLDDDQTLRLVMSHLPGRLFTRPARAISRALGALAATEQASRRLAVG